MSDDKNALYVFNEPITALQVLEKAEEILSERYQREGEFCNPNSAKGFLRLKLAQQEREVFAVMLLDSLSAGRFCECCRYSMMISTSRLLTNTPAFLM